MPPVESVNLILPYSREFASIRRSENSPSLRKPFGLEDGKAMFRKHLCTFEAFTPQLNTCLRVSAAVALQ